PNDLAFPSRDLPYSLHIQAGIQLWMRHFLRIHDIQSVAMFSLFLLGLTVWYAPKTMLVDAGTRTKQRRATVQEEMQLKTRRKWHGK
ncbi:hypothetical protein Ciccas_013241, partial [Cichlidogyrus casuarinus]